MGFNVDPAVFLQEMKIDLMAIGATYEVKLEQALDTCSKIVFLGAPQNINKHYSKQVMDLGKGINEGRFRHLSSRSTWWPVAVILSGHRAARWDV
jgi:hypothetical protein